MYEENRAFKARHGGGITMTDSIAQPRLVNSYMQIENKNKNKKKLHDTTYVLCRRFLPFYSSPLFLFLVEYSIICSVY